jgi:ACS family D-galactonate transporter-like MFS transporter
MLNAYGWRSLFFVVGGLGVAFAFLFHRLYREPQDSSANQAEIDLIAAGGGFSGGTQPIAFSWANVRRLVATRQIAGASIGQFCSNSTLVFFLTWFPSYLAEERGMTFIKSGWLVSLPYIAAAAGVMWGAYFPTG